MELYVESQASIFRKLTAFCLYYLIGFYSSYLINNTIFTHSIIKSPSLKKWNKTFYHHAKSVRVPSRSATIREAYRIFSTYYEHYRLIILIRLSQRCFWVSALHPKCFCLSCRLSVTRTKHSLLSYRVEYVCMKLCILKELLCIILVHTGVTKK